MNFPDFHPGPNASRLLPLHPFGLVRRTKSRRAPKPPRMRTHDELIALHLETRKQEVARYIAAHKPRRRSEAR